MRFYFLYRRNISFYPLSLLLFITALMLPLPAHTQDRMQKIYQEIMDGNTSRARAELVQFEKEYFKSSADSVKSDFYYLRGILDEKTGNDSVSMQHFRQSVQLAESSKYLGTSYLDAILRIMRYDFGHEEYLDACILGQKAIKVHESVQMSYPATPYIYSTLASSLSYIGKFAAVPKVSEKAKPYIKALFSPKDESYYELHFIEAVAYLMMDKVEKADSICNLIYSTITTNKVDIPSLSHAVEQLRENVATANNDKWSKRKQERKATIEKFNEKIMLASTTSEKGIDFWRQYLSMLRETLGYFYFDPKSPKDEEFWNWCLTQLLAHFYVCCDELPDREAEAYDNVLLTKNFMEYHLDKLSKVPSSWKDIENALSEGEAAIEICSLPEEFLLVRKGAEKPQSIPIDTLLLEKLYSIDHHDAKSQNKLYSQEGPLRELWMALDPFLEGVSTIYLSSSNIFTQYNYSAIPLSAAECVGDRYRIINLLSTTDIPNAGVNERLEIRNVLLYGGIRYDIDDNEMKEQAGKYQSKNGHSEWTLTRSLNDSERGNFGFLPGSYDEVTAIDSLMKAHKIHSNVLSGSAANEESLKHAAVNSPDILHLSTHGFMLAPLFNSDDVEIKKKLGNNYQTILSQSGLLLSGANKAWQGGSVPADIEDGILTSGEITELDFSNVKLVVLSACDSGLGETRNLTGASYGLQHAFKSAGVDKLLVCLWKVDDTATSIFMREFYSSLLKSRDVHQALKNAHHELIAKGYIEPCYWAPYMIID